MKSGPAAEPHRSPFNRGRFRGVEQATWLVPYPNRDITVAGQPRIRTGFADFHTTPGTARSGVTLTWVEGCRVWTVGYGSGMESAEPFPVGAVKAPDLAEHLSRTGPFVSVYLHTDPDVERAAERSKQRWKTLRRDLHERGAPVEALSRIDNEVPDAQRRGRLLGVVVDAGGAAHVEHGDPF